MMFDDVMEKIRSDHAGVGFEFDVIIPSLTINYTLLS